MEIGIIGQGKMGAGLSARLLAGGHRVVVYDIDEEAQARAAASGAIVATTGLTELIGMLDPPRVVWIMLPAGEATEAAVQRLGEGMSAGDMLVDGGNCHYKDAIRRAAWLEERGVAFLDVGTSGGVFGEKNGYCLMIGGKAEAVARLRPIFETLTGTPGRGFGHMGPSGAGHYVKMVHNGIEYGMMQAMAEGFALLAGKEALEIDPAEAGRVWQQGSVIRSWLLDLTVRALEENPSLQGIAPFVNDSGEGRWTVQEALDRNIACPVITLSLLERISSRETDSVQRKLLAAMRHQFGGHAIKKI